jgi:hypothetical protein
MHASALLSALAATSLVTAKPHTRSKRANLSPVSAKGTAFYADDQRFYIRGVDYKPGGNTENLDPLANTEICKRDIEHFKELGVNTIRVYAIDNTANHDECMGLLDEAGIYVLVDVNTPKHSINRVGWFDAYLSYNTAYLKNVFATVSKMTKYDNTLAFFSGNEIIDADDTTAAAPFIKAVTRDIKNYQKAQGLRRVPVGYSAADVSSNRVQTANYLNCGPDDSRSDFFAFNDYSWCNSDFDTAGWDKKVETFADYGLPIFLSEYGCIKNRPRKFEELGALMSDKMTAVYSGGMMFEYSNEGNDFGIVEIKGDPLTGTIEELDEYENFKNALAEYPAPTSGDGGAASTTHSVECPTREPGTWDVDPSEVPMIPETAQKLMTDGVSEGDGLEPNGDGTQLPACEEGESVEVCGLSPGNTTEGQSVPGGGNGNGSGSGGNEEDAAGLLQPPMILTTLTVALGLVTFVLI